ncbi:MAG TPA: nucleotidyltransferase domain-containing protein [Acetobacteraceae bacterium]|jgi:hypothetical protein
MKTAMSTKPSQAFDTYRATVRDVVEAHRARNPRVFGSVARRDDDAGSDLDLLVDTTERTSLFDIAAIELELETVMGVPVHVTTSGALRGKIRERVLAEALPV